MLQNPMRDDVPSTPSVARSPDEGPRPSEEVPDAVLAARLAAGERQALEPIYRRHKGLVYRFALMWTGSAPTAADVTQDVFLHLLTRAADFDATLGAFPSWLLGIARNFARRRAPPPPDDFNEEDVASDAPLPEEALAGKRSVESLRSAIAGLPTHYRDVLILIELAERSYVETAMICGCELNTVRSRLSRARGLLARRLAATRQRPMQDTPKEQR
jgi:RNA polymerase sigma-70 factor (ECF subfamily)